MKRGIKFAIAIFILCFIAVGCKKADKDNGTGKLDGQQSTDKDNIPDESTFHTAKNRVVNQTYYWSDTWKRFILSEKKDKATGERVAVIEDYSASPYVLVEEYNNMANNVAIQRQNGTIEIVPSNALWELDGTQAQSTFFCYE